MIKLSESANAYDVTPHNVPVLEKLPTGCVEWAAVGPFLYGIDQAGNVFKLGRAQPPMGAPRVIHRVIHLLTRPLW